MEINGYDDVHIRWYNMQEKTMNNDIEDYRLNPKEPDDEIIDRNADEWWEAFELYDRKRCDSEYQELMAEWIACSKDMLRLIDWTYLTAPSAEEQARITATARQAFQKYCDKWILRQIEDASNGEGPLASTYHQMH